MGHKYIFSLLIILSIFFVACKTAPKAVEPANKMEDSDKDNNKINEDALDRMAKEAEQARNEAIRNGADKTHSSLFEKADEMLRLAKEASNKKDGMKKFDQAKNMYQTLSNLAKCLEYKKEIDENKFQDYDLQKYEDATSFYAKAIEKYNAGDFSSFSDSVESLSLYKSLYDRGYLELAQLAKKAAREAKQKCDDIKASRSMTKDYNEAVGLYNTGNVHMTDKNYKESYKSYTASCDVFNETYKLVEEKRKEAVLALGRAKEKLKASSSLANEADKISPLAEGAEGFEEGDVDSSKLENKDSKKENVDAIDEDS
ncbi:MAG: hypothetical protein ACTTKH_02125 [Treponema sp.]